VGSQSCRDEMSIRALSLDDKGGIAVFHNLRKHLCGETLQPPQNW
jgi:hypothetical protein